MLSVVAFEVLPELFELSHEQNSGMAASLAILFGFLSFHTISFFFPMHEHGHYEEELHNHTHAHSHKSDHVSLGIYGVILMIIHSFIDGFGIGLGFEVSLGLGLAISIAVITHNFSDGINTVSTLILSKASNLKLKLLLGLNIVAPLLGILAGKYVQIPDSYLVLYLGFFSGSILYLAISDILPQAHKDRSQITPIIATLLGVLFVAFITILIPHGH
jgi:ZIP family zinc transporter